MSLEKIEIHVPLELVLDRRYFKLKNYFDLFVELVEREGIDPKDHEVVLTLKEKGA